MVGWVNGTVWVTVGYVGVVVTGTGSGGVVTVGVPTSTKWRF